MLLALDVVAMHESHEVWEMKGPSKSFPEGKLGVLRIRSNPDEERCYCRPDRARPRKQTQLVPVYSIK